MDYNPKLTISKIPLFELEVNYDSLKQFLERFQSVQNQQVNQIKFLEDKMVQKLNEKQAIEAFKIFQDSFGIMDKEFSNEINRKIGSKLRKENSGIEIDDSVNVFSNKLQSVSQALIHLYQKDQEKEKRIQRLENQIITKQTIEKGKSQKRKLKNLIKDETKDCRNTLQNKLHEAEVRLEQMIANFDSQIQNCEKKTIWKINDCEELLKKRVNDEFVLTNIQKLDQKVQNDLARFKGGETTALQIQEDVNLKFKQIQENINQKLKSNKDSLKKFEDTLNSKICKKETFDEFQLIYNQQKQQINTQLQDIEKKTDNTKMMVLFQNHITTLENKCNFMDSNFSKRIDEIQQQSSAQKGAGTSMVFMPANNIDPNRFCMLEKEIKKLKEESDFINKDMVSQIEVNQSIKKAFKIKMDHLDEKLFSSLNQKNLKAMVSQEQLKTFGETIQINLKEKIDELNQKQYEQNTEQMKKINQIKEIEKRLNKLMKEYDFDEMNRQLQQKCEDIEMQKQVRILDHKLGNEQEVIRFIQKDIQKIYKLCQKFYDQTQNNVQDDKLSIGTQKIVPLNCLGCGSVKYPIKRDIKHRGPEGKLFNKPILKTTFIEKSEQFSLDEDQFPVDQSLQSKITRSNKKIGNQSLRPQSAKLKLK